LLTTQEKLVLNKQVMFDNRWHRLILERNVSNIKYERTEFLPAE
jgi:hypothetical protein